MKEFFLPLTEPVGAVFGLMLIGCLWLCIRRQWQGAVWLGIPTVLLFILGSTPLVEHLVEREEAPYGPETREQRLETRDQGPGTKEQGLQTGERQEMGGRTNVVEMRNGDAVVAGQTTNSGVVPAVAATSTNGAVIADGALRGHTNAQSGGTQGSRTMPAGGAVADVVVVLGGGFRMSHYDAFGFAPIDAFARVMTGIELIRTGKGKLLVLGGSYPYPGKPQVPSMTAVQEWVNAWGIARCDVTNLGFCLNTHDEAVAFKKMKRFQDWNSIILVTSALHMKRSVALFKKFGITVEPMASDFEVLGVSQDMPFSIFPREHRFRLWGLYLHEKIGWMVYRNRGWV